MSHSGRQRERLRLDVDEHAAERAYSAIEIGGFGALQVGEEAADPRREMLLEQLAVSACRRREARRR